MRDYYEGCFDGDAGRMQRSLQTDLVKRGFGDDATGGRVRTKYGVDRRHIDISINHVRGNIGDVHVTGDVYLDYLHLVHVDGRWQILNALWARA